MLRRNVYDDDYLCDNNTKDKIKLKLLDMQNALDLNNIECQFSAQDIELDSISLKEAQMRLEIYTNISKLSIYLMNDYDFFSKASLQSAFKCPVYNTAMENLGYKRLKSTWTSYNKPTQDTIIENIFKYCFYSYIVKVKKAEQTNYEPRNRNFTKFFDSGDYRNNEIQSNSTYSNRNTSPYRNKQNFSHDERYMQPFKKHNQFHNQKKISFEQETHQQRSRQAERSEQAERYQPDRQGSRDNNYRKPAQTDNERNQPDRRGFQDNYYRKPPHIDNEPVNLPKKAPIKPQENKEVLNQWRCDVCECMNSFRVKKCEACDSRGPGFEKWSCVKCTFLNEPNSFNCTICGSVNENVIDARGIK